MYFYAVFNRSDGEPYVTRFEGPMTSDYFQGASPSMLVATIPLHEGMTKKDLLSFDAAEDTNYWEHPDWADG